jgi:hypothetical protein
MKDLFIPYELALIAKEKGFNEFCFGGYFYDREGARLLDWPEHGLMFFGQINSEQTEPENCSAPLFQQIVDWFRNEHKIVLEMLHGGRHSTDFTYWGCKIFKPSNGLQTYINNPDLTKNNDLQSYSYYEALNKAIEEAFKLI